MNSQAVNLCNGSWINKFQYTSFFLKVGLFTLEFFKIYTNFKIILTNSNLIFILLAEISKQKAFVELNSLLATVFFGRSKKH